MVADDKIRCALAASERRLCDALSLWRDAKKNYFDPDAFRLSLNNGIQALRSVSWILQKSKREFSAFQRWYGRWQERMRADPVLAWFVQVRNIIVKEGDLATHSRARVGVVKSWFEPASIEIEASPFATTEDFAKIVTKAAPQTLSLQLALLRVERRWVDFRLPSHELLEALAHVFGVLSELLLDAHETLLATTGASCCTWYTQQIPFKGRLPPCMSAQDWDRTTWIDLPTGERLIPTVDTAGPTEEHVKKAAKRYPALQDHLRKMKSAKSLEEEAVVAFEFAKTALQTDGYHLPIAIVGHADGSKTIHLLDMQDRSTKHLAFRQLAADMERTSATSVIINEVWVSQLRDREPLRFPTDDPRRREGLLLVAADASGKTYTRKVLFHRNKNGRIRLGKESVSTDATPLFLAPIVAVWPNKNLSIETLQIWQNLQVTSARESPPLGLYVGLFSCQSV